MLRGILLSFTEADEYSGEYLMHNGTFTMGVVNYVVRNIDRDQRSLRKIIDYNSISMA